MSTFSLVHGDSYYSVHQQNLATYQRSQEELKNRNAARTYEYDANRSQIYEQILDDRAVPVDPDESHAFQSMYDFPNEDQTRQYELSAVRGVHNRTLLSDLYFSEANRKHVDERIRYEVYKLSDRQYSLGPQDPSSLWIIMRSIYLQYGLNYKCQIKEQIKRLNDITVKEIVPRLLSNTTQYIKYLEDANEGHKVILPRPINVNGKGTRILIMSDGLGFSGYRQVQ